MIMFVKKLKKNWRAPRGIHSKTRRKFIGRAKHPTVGFSGPRPVRGLNRKGLMPVIIKNTFELEKVDKNKHAVVVGHVGKKKKYAIVKKSLELGLVVDNVSNPNKFLKTIEARLEKAKKEKESKLKKKEAKEEKNKKVKKEEVKKDSKEEKKPVKKENVKKEPQAKKTKKEAGKE